MSKAIDRAVEAAIATELDCAEWHRDIIEELVRAIVVSLREPSQGARVAGHAALVESHACKRDLGPEIGYAALGDAWRAMIDDILA